MQLSNSAFSETEDIRPHLGLPEHLIILKIVEHCQNAAT